MYDYYNWYEIYMIVTILLIVYFYSGQPRKLIYVFYASLGFNGSFSVCCLVTSSDFQTQIIRIQKSEASNLRTYNVGLYVYK